MSAFPNEKKAPGGWRATQGGIPVTGTKVIYRVGRWVQRLFSRTVWAMEQRLPALDIKIERRTLK
jgi:hypothetical protein